MIASGLHSGLAIKRQRKRRMEHLRARERRFSTRSNESGMSSFGSPRGSIDGGRRNRKRNNDVTAGIDSNVGIGMLHIGVVFVVLGIFLFGSGLCPDDFSKFEWEDFGKLSTWWNELVVTGAFSLLLGVFLIVLNKFISNREENELEDYVARQLNRSRSGHALVRDVETGNLTTKRSKSSNLVTDDVRKNMVEDIPDIHATKTPPPVYDSHPHFFPNGDATLLSPQLEQIEEEPSERERGHQTDGFLSASASVSTMSPSETQDLLTDQPYIPAVPSKYHQEFLHSEVIIRQKSEICTIQIRAETNINMMGAMGAVAVRLERRKAEGKRQRRPSQLYLSGYNIRQQNSPTRTSPTPSPVLSPPKEEEVYTPEVYVCGKISALHLAVVSLLLGAVILIVGLVQFKPGADAPGHRFYLINIGCVLEGLGLAITAVRCILLHCKMERRQKSRKIGRSSGSQQGATVMGSDLETGEEKVKPLSIDLKHLYNSSDVMYIDDSDTSARPPKSPSERTTDKVDRRSDECSLPLASPSEQDVLLAVSDQGGGP